MGGEGKNAEATAVIREKVPFPKVLGYICLHNCEIKGRRRELTDQLDVKDNARYFSYEEEPMYSKRETQLLQQYIARHGEMPEGNRELDDLF